MKKLGRLLNDAMGNSEVLRSARAQKILHDWDQIVGEQLATKSWPDRYERGTVWVAVTGSSWAQELRMRKEMILARLREQVPDHSLFMDVRFGVRPLPPRPQKEEQTVAEEPVADERKGMTIREIAARRLANWVDTPPKGD